jgi:hypothetical protein
MQYPHYTHNSYKRADQMHTAAITTAATAATATAATATTAAAAYVNND